jgi:hypothetical protein
MTTPLPATLELQPMTSQTAQKAEPIQSTSPPPALSPPSVSRWHSPSYYVGINVLQVLAALAVAAFAVVVAGWQHRPGWVWSYISWYFFALGGIQFFSVLVATFSVAKQSKIFLIGALFFFTIATCAVIATGLMMLIPDFRSSFLSSCFTPFVSAEYKLSMVNFEMQYCVTATGSASEFGRWAAWCLALVGTFVQLPWIVYVSFHSPSASVVHKPSPLSFNKLPQLDPSIPVTLAATVGAKDVSGGCGILFAPTNQSGTLQVVCLFT